MLHGRDFLWEGDFSQVELTHLMNVAAQLKANRRTTAPALAGKNLALLFEKTSTRTRAAFEVAMREEGGHVSAFDPQDSQVGHKESIADTARMFSGMYDAIAYRGNHQDALLELAAYADIPVYNALTNEWHPTQMLADFMTMYEHVGSYAPTYAYVGDARSNMGNSTLIMGAIMGSDIRIVAPESLWPEPHVRALAQERADDSGARITITSDLEEGLTGVDFVHTDVWVSMGESEDVWAQRVDALRPYRVDEHAMAYAPNAKFMHCLPAYHDQGTKIGRQIAAQFGLTDGVEVSDAVFESPQSIVFEQATNRLHTIKALLVETLAD